MPEYTFADCAAEVLQLVDKPMTYQEIWEEGVERGIAEKLGTSGKTPWQTLGARLFVDVRDNPDTRFLKIGKNPARFYLKSRQDELTPEILQQIKEDTVEKPPRKEKFPFNERDLHPLFAYYAYSNPSFNRGKQIYTKTIYHEKSRHSSPSEWTYPDMVGFYLPIEDWNNKLIELSKISDRAAIRFYSFELKKNISRRNYRECFFQAVSNSSWANEGYLVASSVQQRDDLLSELERLSSAFGIGIIILDVEDVDSSSVLFPAKERENLDWELMNKLCEQNEDFESFIDNVRKDFEVNTIHPSVYDEIISDVEKYTAKLLKH